MTTWPRGRPPALVPVRLPDGRTLRVGADLAEALVHLRGGTTDRATLARLLAPR
ncbi:MAG: hypothetical protein KJZ81_07805 [Burkholderiaceae bacterium]|nr:hypothetical protein [Burkholderiaceae bacterium]